MGRSGISAVNLDQRKSLWDWIDNHHPELWDQPAPLRYSDQILSEMVGVLAVPASRKHRLRSSIRNWLSDPGLYSPHMDESALERALAFDWGVIERLSSVETAEFYSRLAAMDDSFSEDEEDRDPITGKLRSASNRRLAWLSGSASQQNRVCMGVIRATEKVAA